MTARQIRKLLNKELAPQGKRECFRCKAILPVDQFHLSTDKYRKYKSHCRTCDADRALHRRHTDVHYHLSWMLNTIEHVNAPKRGLECTLTRDHMYQMWERQEGLCALTGEPMTLLPRQENTVSVDRIDSSQGYTPENCQLVCLTVNNLKRNLPQERLLYWCKQIVQKSAVSRKGWEY